MSAIFRAIDNLNRRVGTSTFGRIFRLEGSGHVRNFDLTHVERYTDR